MIKIILFANEITHFNFKHFNVKLKVFLFGDNLVRRDKIVHADNITPVILTKGLLVHPRRIVYPFSPSISCS